MDGKPLLGSYMLDSSPDLSSSKRDPPIGPKNAITLFVASIFLNVIFCILAFALPNNVSFIVNATHLGVVHAVLYSFVLIIFTMMRNLDIPQHHRLVQHLLNGPFLIAMITNILIVFLLGLESWMEESDAEPFSSLQLVQILSVIQSGSSLFVGLVVLVKTNKPATVVWHEATDGGTREEFTSFLNMNNSSVNLSIGSPSVDATPILGPNEEWLLQKTKLLERREQDLTSALESVLSINARKISSDPESNAYDLLTKYSRPGQGGQKPVSKEDIETLANSILRLSSEHQRLMNEKQEVIDREMSIRKELQKSNTDISRLRQENKESKRKIDSISGTLQIERERNAASEQLIQSLRERIELLEQQHPMNAPIQGGQIHRLGNFHRPNTNGAASGPSSLLSTPMFSPPNSMPSSSPLNNPAFTRDCEQARSIITALATGPAKNRQHASSRAASFNTHSPARTIPGSQSMSFNSGTQGRSNHRDSHLLGGKSVGNNSHKLQAESFALDKTSSLYPEKRST